MSEEKLINILVVDDSADDRHIAKKILEKNDFRVSEASSWIEALQLIANGNIDLLLLDLKMPEVDGMELLGMIRKKNSKLGLPAIIYSSCDLDDVKDADGANAFIEKYGDPSKLLKKVREILKIDTSIRGTML